MSAHMYAAYMHIHTLMYNPTLDNPTLVSKDILTFLQYRYGGVVLELIEGPFQHVLWIDLFDPQQVQHHVVGQVEGTI